MFTNSNEIHDLCRECPCPTPPYAIRTLQMRLPATTTDLTQLFVFSCLEIKEIFSFVPHK